MRIVDILMAFPGILLAIAMVAVLIPGLNHVILALCLIGWVGYARLVRAQVLICAKWNTSQPPTPSAQFQRASLCSTCSQT